MTSFALIAGLLPLVFATGPGAIGNRTIGTSAAGGMLLGTVIGVLVIPGLYYLFGKIADKRKLLKDETDEPLSEVVETDEPRSELVELKPQEVEFFRREAERLFERMRREQAAAFDEPLTDGEIHTSPPENRPQEATTEVQLKAEHPIANALVAIGMSGSDLITEEDPSTRIEQATEKAL
jgi:hypothetical protein